MFGERAGKEEEGVWFCVYFLSDRDGRQATKRSE